MRKQIKNLLLSVELPSNWAATVRVWYKSDACLFAFICEHLHGERIYHIIETFNLWGEL